MAYSRGIKIDDELTRRIEDTASKFVHENGVESLTVRKILQELGVSNRVFYNRFQSLEELLQVIYVNEMIEMRKNLPEIISCSDDEFFDYCLDILVNVLKGTYYQKKNFSHYMFEHDALTDDNRTWWVERIKAILGEGLRRKLIRDDLDIGAISYSIWCFCRGFNVDAVNRHLPIEEAVRQFRQAFSVYLDGMRA